MRILTGLAAVALASVIAGPAIACAPGALGTARTIKIDPTEIRKIEGLEPELGLRHKEVVLTFDDGPIAGKTSRVLKALADECVKATFFQVGRMAKSYPRLVRRIVAQGHTLAHHTWGHNRLTAYKPARAGELIDLGIAKLETIAYGETGGPVRVPFLRYPYLAGNAQTAMLAAQRGLTVIGANIDSRDWTSISPGAVHDRIMKRLRQDGRGIVLMHDIQARTATMLPRLLRTLKAEGYSVVHLEPAGPAAPVEPLVVASGVPALPSLSETVAEADAIVTAAMTSPTLEPVAAVAIARPAPQPAAVQPLRKAGAEHVVAAAGGTNLRSASLRLSRLPATTGELLAAPASSTRSRRPVQIAAAAPKLKAHIVIGDGWSLRSSLN